MTEAFCKFISIDFNNSHQSLLENIDLAFKEEINNTKIKVLELNKTEQKWITIVNNLKLSITFSDDQLKNLLEDK